MVRVTGRVSAAVWAVALLAGSVATSIGLGAAPVGAQPPTFPTRELISAEPSGGIAPGGGHAASLSADGSLVAYATPDPGLTPGNTLGSEQVLVRDRVAGTTTPVSVAPDGTLGNGPSDKPFISANGRYVVFSSLATNLVAGVTSGAVPEVYRRDLQTGETTLITAAADGTPGNAESLAVGVSADGDKVLFDSVATNLPPGIQPGLTLPAGTVAAPVSTVFLATVSTGAMTRVSDALGSTTTSWIHGAGLTPDGRFVVVAASTVRFPAISPTGVTQLGGSPVAYGTLSRIDTRTMVAATASILPDGVTTTSDATTFSPMSSDGNTLLFSTRQGLMLRHLATGRTESLLTGGATAQGLTPDGRFALFTGTAPSVPSSPNSPDLYAYDIQHGSIQWLSDTATYGSITAVAGAAISADGTTAVFDGVGATDPTQEVYARALGPAPATLTGRVTDAVTGQPIEGAYVDAVLPGQPGTSTRGHTVTKADGTWTLKASPGTYRLRISAYTYLWASQSGDLWTGANPTFTLGAGDSQAFPVALIPWNTPPGTTRNVLDSVTPSGTPVSNGVGNTPYMSPDGRYVAFTNGANAAIRDRLTGTLTTTIDGRTLSSFAFSDDDRFLVYTDGAHAWERDLATGAAVRVDVATDGTVGGSNRGVAVSADGRYVTFVSSPHALNYSDPDQSPTVFVRDTVSSTTARASTAGDGSALSGGVANDAVTLSADGRYVTFSAVQPVPGASGAHIVRKDLLTGAVAPVDNGVQAANPAVNPQMSRDSRYAIFATRSTGLTADAVDGHWNIFRRNLTTGAITLVSTTAGGAVASGDSTGASVSADGRYVSFTSSAALMAPGEPMVPSIYSPSQLQVVVRDLDTGAGEWMSVPFDPSDPTAVEGGWATTISARGDQVTWVSGSTALVPKDNGAPNNTQEVYSRFVAMTADTTPPTVACASPDGQWHSQDVAITCTAADLGLGLGNPADASFTLSTSVPTGTVNASATTASQQVCDLNFNCVTAGPVTGNEVDKVAPTAAITSPTPAASYPQAATVPAAFGCTDADSGLASCVGSTANGSPVPTDTVGPHTLTVVATDQAGNTTTATQTYRVTGASLSGTLTDDQHNPGTRTTVDLFAAGGPAPLATTTTDASGQFSFADVAAGSYQLRFSRAGRFLTTWYLGAASQAASAAIVVPAGGAVVANDTLVTDPTADVSPPVIHCGAADGLWHTTDVTIACTATDAPAGLANPADASFTLSTAVPAGTASASAATGTRQVCDLNGNCATAGPVTGIQVDKAAPAITFTAPADGALLAQNAVANAAYSCADTGAGIASCTGTIANGAALPTATVGTFTVTVTATDQAGNTTQVTHSYTVQLATLTGVVTDSRSHNPAVGVTVRLWKTGAGSATATTTTGAGGAYTFANVAPGTYNVQFTQSGVYATDWYQGVTSQSKAIVLNLATPNTVVANDSVIATDLTAPTVTCASADTNWHGTQVSIACTAADNTGGSGLAVTNDKNFTLSTSVPAGTTTTSASTGTHTVCDKAGNCVTAGPVGGIKVDLQAPAITPAVPIAGGTYGIGTVVSASYSCSDGGSGVSTCAGTVATGSPLDTSTMGNKSFTITATDPLGNATSQTFSYQVTGATIAVTLSGQWALEPLHFQLALWPVGSSSSAGAASAGTAYPAIGGPATATFTNVPPGQYQIQESSPGSVEPDYPTQWYPGSATRAGAASVTVAGNQVVAINDVFAKVDTTPPSATCSSPYTGWSAGAATITCSVWEEGNNNTTVSWVGLDPSVPAPILSTTVPPGTVSTDVTVPGGQWCDKVGNCTTVGPWTGWKIDHVAPVATLSAPADGSTVIVGDVVPLGSACSDVGAGVASCTFMYPAANGHGATPVGANLDTSTTGTRTVVLTATDGAGNTTTVSRSYTVAPVPSVGTITGTLTDRYTHQPIVGAQVWLTNTATNSGIGAITDAAGSWTFGSLATGDYTVGFLAIGQVPTWYPGRADPSQAQVLHLPVGPTVIDASDQMGPVDTTGPAVACAAADGAWHNTQVQVPCFAADPNAGLADPGAALTIVSTSVAPGTASANAVTGPATVCDRAGNCSVVGPVAGNQVDLAPPTIDLNLPASGAVYALGQVVPAQYSCADVGAGLASCVGSTASGAAVDTSTPGSHTFSVTATDGAGNVTTDTSEYTVMLGGSINGTLTDQLSGHPVVGASVSVFPVGSPVPVASATTDAAGAFTVAMLTPASYSVEITGAGYKPVWYLDAPDQGHSTPVAVTPGGTATIMESLASPDSTAPVVSCTPSATGWSLTDIQETCSAQDEAGGSGLANPSDASFVLATSVPDGTETASASTPSRVVCDRAANCVTAGPFTGLEVDEAAPTITMATPAAGTVVPADSVLPADYNCADGGSGVAACAASTAAGDPLPTSQLGTFAFTVNAVDAAGNTSALTHSYTVRGGTISGTLTDRYTGAPVKNAGVRLYLNGSANSAASVPTDLQGRWSATNLADGTYQILFTGTGEAPTWYPTAGVRSAAGSITLHSGSESLDATTLFGPYDTTPPVVTCAAPDGLWHSPQAQVSCQATDDASGVATFPSGSFVVSTAVPTGMVNANASTTALSVCDRANNCTTVAPIPGNEVDSAKPTVSVSSPVAGAAYLVGSSVTAAYSCADSGSGVSSCTGPIANGGALPTGTGGANSLVVTAQDGAGNTTTSTVAYNVATGMVSGRLIDATSAQAVAGANVRLWVLGGANPTLTTVTGADGRYSFGPMLPGSFQLQFAAAGYNTVWWPSAASRPATAGVVVPLTGTFTADASLPRLLTGTVTGTLSTSASGAPLSGATVQLWTATGTVAAATTTTAADGSFTFPTVSPGTYTLYATALGSTPSWYLNAATRAAATPFSVTAAGTVTLFQSLAPAAGSATVSGLVISATTGRGLAGMFVRFWASSTQTFVSATTDSTGHYSIVVPTGSYDVQFAGSGEATQWYPGATTRAGQTPVVLTNGQRVTISAALTP